MEDGKELPLVVICFHFSIFEPLETTRETNENYKLRCDLLSF